MKYDPCEVLIFYNKAVKLFQHKKAMLSYCSKMHINIKENRSSIFSFIKLVFEDVDKLIGVCCDLITAWWDIWWLIYYPKPPRVVHKLNMYWIWEN